MSLLVALLGSVVLSHCCCALRVSDQDGRIAGDRASGASGTTDAALTPPREESEVRQLLGNYPFPPGGFNRPQRCPLCDSSVYPYCGEKLLHDACCCTESHSHHHDVPYQCRLADCRFLHADTCKEHRLIANCCCSDDYRAVLKTLANT